MELDDLKNIWHSEESYPANDKATRALLDEITHRKYRSRMNKIRYPELAGSLVCVVAAIFIGCHFRQLHTGLLQGAGIAAIILLLLVPLLSLASLKKLAINGNIGQPYAEVLKVFAKQKLKFYRLQKINVTLSCALLVTVVILLPVFFGGNQIANPKSFWVFSFTAGYLFLLLFSTLVFRFYKGAIRQTEALLQEIERDTV